MNRRRTYNNVYPDHLTFIEVFIKDVCLELQLNGQISTVINLEEYTIDIISDDDELFQVVYSEENKEDDDTIIIVYNIFYMEPDGFKLMVPIYLN